MMFSAASLWTLLALLITGSAIEVRNSTITLPMTSRLHFSNGTNPVRREDAQNIGVTLENVMRVSCVLIGVGDPLTFYRLVVNTGSANTWIGAASPYIQTHTAFDTQLVMKMTYPTVTFTGILFTDTVEITDGLTINAMDIGVVNVGTQRRPYDGMLGIGPHTASQGSIPSEPQRMLFTVTERLFEQGSISRAFVGLFLKPSTNNMVDHDNGRLVFGQEDLGFNIGNIAYTHVTYIEPASTYWGIDQSITYDNTEISPLTAGVVDSGTTFIYLASDAYEKYKTVTGAKLDLLTGMLSITLEQYDALLPLKFHIGEQIYNLCPNAQIWPRWLNAYIEGTSNGIYLVIKSLNRPTGGGYDFLLGYVFLQRFYSVFDVIHDHVGFATTPYTDATTN